MKVSIVGASGYAGGELLRLLLFHPRVSMEQATSRRWEGRFVTAAQPNLRGCTRLKFSPVEALEPCDILFLALPHGEGLENRELYQEVAPRIIDLSADYRLEDAGQYPRWYGYEHPAPSWLGEYAYGLPELHREQIAQSHRVSGPGCLAAAVILGLAPLFSAGLVPDNRVVVEGKLGSSAGGNAPSLSGHHPERTGVIRAYKPTGHRHTAEAVQELSALAGEKVEVHLTATSVEAVRGIQVTGHVFLDQDVEERDLWQVYRRAYGSEPFMRLVKERRGVYRYPEPKLLAGSNYCDVGFVLDEESRRLVVLSALDNLMKGAAGAAVQAMNIMMGWEETLGLEFPGLHP